MASWPDSKLPEQVRVPPKLGPGIGENIPSQAGGILKGAGGLLGTVSSFLGPIGAAAGLAGQIGSLFRKSPEGLKKIKETKSQQGVEQAAARIAEQVRNGQMDPNDGLTALKQLQEQASGQPGGLASIAVTNAMAEVSSAANNQMGAPLDQNPDLRGSEASQGQRLRTSVRNGLTGSGLGPPAGSPLSRLLEPTDVMGKLSQARGIADTQFAPPDRSASDRIGELLRKRFS